VPITTNITWKDLYQAEYGFDQPFQLTLNDNQVFISDKVVRIIPKKRLVAFGVWRGKPVVAKLFFDKQSKRHLEKDATGIKILQENKVPTPTLLFQGTTHDKRVQVLLFERIFNAKNLEEIWQEKQNIEDILPQLQTVIVELATQHVLGITQKDLHLKNFLLTDKVIYTLDGAQIEIHPTLLPKKESLENLTLFLAQFGIGQEALQEKLFVHYAKSRGWLLKNGDIAELFYTIKKINHERWKRYENKIFRDSTSFAAFNVWATKGMYDREFCSSFLINFFKNPDEIFQHQAIKILKNGRSSTVILTKINGKMLVIKRYNIKNVWHFLRRMLRPTRATNCWRLALKLNLFGVKTAKPIAFFEKKYLGLRGKSYYVMEFVDGENLKNYLAKERQHDENRAHILSRVVTLLRNLAKLEITHGDLKATNILINENQQPVLIDLDGAAEHFSLSGLRAAWRKEIKRFLKNFHDMPSVEQALKVELCKMD